MTADCVHDTLNRSVIRWIQLLQYAHQIVFRKSKSLAFQMRNGLGRQRTTKQLHIIDSELCLLQMFCFFFVYLSQRERTPSGAVLGLECLWRNDPFAPTDFVKVHRQFPPLAKRTARIFRHIQSGIVDVLLHIPEERKEMESFNNQTQKNLL